MGKTTDLFRNLMWVLLGNIHLDARQRDRTMREEFYEMGSKDGRRMDWLRIVLNSGILY
jgi:hypothetical protein